VVVALRVVDDEVGDVVVVVDEAIGGFVWYRSLGVKFCLDSVDSSGIEVCLMSEVGAAGFGSVGEGDGDVLSILEGDGGVREERQSGVRGQTDFVFTLQRFLERLEDTAGRFGRRGVVDNSLVNVPDGADGVFVDKDGKVARQVTKSLSGGAGLVVDLDGGLRGVGHVEGFVMDERMEVFRFTLGFLYVCGPPRGFFRWYLAIKAGACIWSAGSHELSALG
jgi:hypothetical protein